MGPFFFPPGPRSNVERVRILEAPGNQPGGLQPTGGPYPLVTAGGLIEIVVWSPEVASCWGISFEPAAMPCRGLAFVWATDHPSLRAAPPSAETEACGGPLPYLRLLWYYR